MIDARSFVDFLDSVGVNLYTGVPDSLLKPLCDVIMTLPPERHVLTANEGNATGVAIGHYLRTGSPAVVYLQNSGFGNAVNPLISLADPDVYGIPMLLLVGWRGEEGVPDEPQHITQGRIMAGLLDSLEIPWEVLPSDQDAAHRAVSTALKTSQAQSRPHVMLVRKDSFAKTGTPPGTGEHRFQATREEMLTALVDALGPEPIVVSTTGMLSRELFEKRQRSGGHGNSDFLTVGGMGHASSIALGVAMREPRREIWCLDGDGAILMHLGSLAVISQHAPPTFFHAVFNNGVHDSVGGQPTAIGQVDLPAAARSMGYRHALAVSDPGHVPAAVNTVRAVGGPALIELQVRPGNRADLGRPTRSPAESKEAFMASISSERATPDD